MKSSRSRRRARALGAAMAGILAGSSLALAQGSQAAQSGASLRASAKKQLVAADEGDEPNGCNGPNGCSGDDSKDGA